MFRRVVGVAPIAALLAIGVPQPSADAMGVRHSSPTMRPCSSENATGVAGAGDTTGVAGGTVASTGVARAGATIASAVVVTTDGALSGIMGVSSVAIIAETTGTANSASAGPIMTTTAIAGG